MGSVGIIFAQDLESVYLSSNLATLLTSWLTFLFTDSHQVSYPLNWDKRVPISEAVMKIKGTKACGMFRIHPKGSAQPLW